jgi:hypothetical protein
MAGVKVFVALPRLASVTVQEFHDHWRHPHATLGLGITTATHYVQSHRVDTHLLGAGQARYDGIAEVWFDNLSDATGMREHHVYREFLSPDEPTFIDMAELGFIVADEEVLMSGPNADPSMEVADAAWRERQRPTTTKLIQLFQSDATAWVSDDDFTLGRSIGALRHTRCYANPAAPGGSIRGVRELWWPTVSDFQRGVARARDAWERLLNQPKDAIALLASAERFF